MVHFGLVCTVCGASNRVHAAFCASCGRPLQTSTTPFTGQLAPLHLLKQRYRIISSIGQGGFSTVYKAVDTALGNRLVAIKEMSQSGLGTQEKLEATQAFKHEVLMLAGLTHPNLPRIYDHFVENGHCYLVMDHIEGETLEQFLQRIDVHSLPLTKILDIGIQLGKVLNHLHTHQPPIVFRDLKPSNIMLTPGGDLYLIDFGIARFFQPGKLDTRAFGSLGYAAPEQYGKARTTPRSDIYSLGAVLHQLLTGHDPLTNTPTIFDFPLLQLPGQPTGLEELIMQMLEMSPANRPTTMTVVKRELERILAVEIARKSSTSPASLSHSVYQHPVVRASSIQQASSPSPQPQIQGPPPIGSILCTYQGHYPGYPEGVTAVAWSPGGKRIASGSSDGTIQVWSAFTGSTFLTYRGHSGWINAVAWSPDGRYIASADNKAVQVWHAGSGSHVSIYRGHNKEVNAIAWSPDGTRIASASSIIKIWYARQPSDTILKYAGHSRFWRRNVVNAVAWSPDGTLIASGGADKTVQIWDTATGDNILTYRGYSSLLYTLSWSPDGTLIASGGGDGTIQVWDTASGDIIFTYYGHADPQIWVNAVAWSPDGTLIASGGNDGIVQVWDTVNGDTIFTYRGHSDSVNALAWSPDGSLIASASSDGTVQVWQAT